MGLIYWTDSLVNGDNVTQSHITTLKNDITAIVNGNITNSNVNASAAIAESKLAFDTTSGHDHDGTDSKAISLGSYLRSYIWGCELVWVSVATVKATAGILELNGSVYSRTADSTTLDMTNGAHWLNGSEAANMWAYVYAYNSSGTSWDIKFSNEAPQYSNCGTSTSGPLIYRSYSSVWYRCIGRVRNDASSNLIRFKQDKDLIITTDAQSFACGTSAAFAETDITAVTSVVDGSALFGAECTAQFQVKYRSPNSADAEGISGYIDVANEPYIHSWFIIEAGSTYDRAIDYKSDGVATVTGWIIAVGLNIR
jgi:hypothetical protein